MPKNNRDFENKPKRQSKSQIKSDIAKSNWKGKINKLNDHTHNAGKALISDPTKSRKGRSHNQSNSARKRFGEENKTIKSDKPKQTSKYRQTNNKKDILLQGNFIGNKGGFGFVRVEGQQDLYVSKYNLKGAINGDTVLVQVIGNNANSTEAKVVSVLKRANNQIVGTIKEGYFVPDNSKYESCSFLMDGNKKLEENKKYVFKISKQGENGVIEGRITEDLGDNDNIITKEIGIIREYNLKETFPKKVEEAAENLTSITEEEMEGRVDYRDKVMFTIDGEDARDFDDAVSLEKDGDLIKLGVHIADVGHYVPQGSVIDEEAYVRGTSVYFPNMVLPMLPEKLSNDLCSLRPNEDRLTMTTFIWYDKEGKVVKSDICESVINSKARMTYTDVYKVLQGDEDTCEKYAELKETFVQMNELAKVLAGERFDRGALDFDLPECEFDVDEDLQMSNVRKRERNDAHRLIESFMIASNEAVAELFNRLGLPFVYRIHEAPIFAKLNRVIDFMESLGMNVPRPKNEITPEYYQALLRATEANPEMKEIINKVILRSLQKAKYSPECLGHFGLGSKYYCHFTSPIRRYSDLTIHRIIKAYLHHELDNVTITKLKEFVKDASNQASQTERNADEAEYSVDDLCKAQLMQKHIGEEFEGVVSNVVENGIFVQLDNTVEGFISKEKLGRDNFLFFEKALIFRGVSTGKMYRLGDKVKIVVESANLDTRKVDFALAQVLRANPKEEKKTEDTNELTKMFM